MFSIISWVIALFVGFGTGFLSACGLGGGTLLLLYLLEITGTEQQIAQGINLLYFLPTALFALISHWKGGYVQKKMAFSLVLSGIIPVFLGATLSNQLPTDILRKCFGGLLLLVGVLGLWQEEKNPEKK